MKVGINLPLNAWREGLRAFPQTGFRFLLLKWLNKLSWQELKELRSEIELFECVPFSLHASAYLFLDDPLFYDLSLSRMKDEVLRAKTVGCRDLTFHPPMILDPALSSSERNKLFLDFLVELDDFVFEEKANLTISVENSFDRESALCKPDEFTGIISETERKNIGVCLDTGHINMLGVTPEQAIKSIPHGMIHATHLHDNQGVSDEHKVPGEGNINWPDVFQALSDNGYTRPLVFEVLSERESPETIGANIMKAWTAFENIENLKFSQHEPVLTPPRSVEGSALDLAYDEAELFFSKKLYEKALTAYQAIVDSDALSNKAYLARFKIAFMYQKMGALDLARNAWHSFGKLNKLALLDGVAPEVLKRLS